MTGSSGVAAARVAVVSQAVVLDAPGFTSLRQRGVELATMTASADESEQVDRLQGHFAVVAGPERYSRSVMEVLPDLRVISRSGVGYDAIDVAAASDLGIHVTVTAGVNAHGVAEHTLTLLLAQLHRVRYYDSRVRDGAWRDGAFFRELRGSTVGIVGLGRIGLCFAELLKPFEVSIQAYDPFTRIGSPAGSGIEFHDSLQDMLPLCHALSLHVPLTSQTRHLIGPAELDLLPRGAILVNTSRGPVVDEVAVAAALQNGQLGGAALDVFETEPPLSSAALLSSDRVTLSPHISSFGRRTILNMSDLVAEQLSAVLRGEAPEGDVTQQHRAT